jgi:hypothetical protein
MAAGRKSLSDVYGPPLYGIKTGLNDAFIVRQESRDAMIARDVRSSDLLKPFLIGENLRRWHVVDDDLSLIYTPKNRIDIEEYPSVRDHLLPFREALENRATKQNWWELQQAQAAYESFFNSQNVVWRDISKGPTFSFLEIPHYLDCTAFFWRQAPKSLVAFLGSKSFWYQLAGLTPIASGDYCRLKAQYFRQITWIDTSSLVNQADEIQLVTEQRVAQIAAFVRRCHDFANNRTVRSSGKLARWYMSDFSAFRATIKNVFGGEIPVSERDEWERYFDARKAEVEELSSRIADAEAEINDRVYRLFELDRDEIALIEEEIAGQY